MDITVFVTVYNVAEFLPRFFECVAAQSFSDYTLLIYDDGSEDNTLELCKRQAASDERFVTPRVTSAEAADGPAMVAGIQLAPNGDGTVRGEAQGVHLFDVDQMGAQLIRLADGSRSIDDLAASLDEPASPVDVAAFFVALGQAGYLANTVLVNLVEIPA